MSEAFKKYFARVTRFGKIVNVVGHYCGFTLYSAKYLTFFGTILTEFGNFQCFWAYFRCCKWLNIERKLCIHLVTLFLHIHPPFLFHCFRFLSKICTNLDAFWGTFYGPKIFEVVNKKFNLPRSSIFTLSLSLSPFLKMGHSRSLFVFSI